MSFALKVHNFTFSRLCRFCRFSQLERTYSKTTVPDEAATDETNSLNDYTLDLENEFDTSMTEEYVREIRNISGLKPYLRTRMKDRLEYTGPQPMFRNEKKKVEFLRKMYAKYGESSGINPAIAWPSLEEFNEILLDEKELEPSLQEMRDAVEEEKRSEMEQRLEKEMFVEQQMKKMPEYIQKYKEKVQSQRIKVQVQSERLDSLLDEAREFYGYAVTKKDNEFQQFVEDRAEKERLERRKLKKQQKLKARTESWSDKKADEA